MTDLNIVGLTGRLVKNCEMRYTNAGFAICSFSIAVNRRKKAQDGSWNDNVSFFECNYFGKAAEGVSQYLTKGQQVSIQGYLDQQNWENNGQKRSKVVVVVNSLSLLGSNQGTQGNQGQRQQTSQPKQNYQAQGQYKQPQPIYEGGVEDFISDDIDF